MEIPKQDNIEKLKAKARKLKALADRGIGGEKETSERMYKEFIKKNKLDESDIDPSVNKRKFRIKTYDDSLILNNVILSINPFTKVISNDLFIECNLDDEDFKEVKEKFRYFVKLYRIEKELLNMAFFNKHNKFFTPDEQVRNKWRENNNENEELRKAREQAEKITNKSNKIKDDLQSKLNLEKMKKDNQIQMLNMIRLNEMTKLLIDGEYIKMSMTIEQQKK